MCEFPVQRCESRVRQNKVIEWTAFIQRFSNLRNSKHSVPHVFPFIHTFIHLLHASTIQTIRLEQLERGVSLRDPSTLNQEELEIKPAIFWLSNNLLRLLSHCYTWSCWPIACSRLLAGPVRKFELFRHAEYLQQWGALIWFWQFWLCPKYIGVFSAGAELQGESAWVELDG